MIEVVFVIGFLGTGKTTLIKRLLPELLSSDEKVVVVVNDFGKENYDALQFQEYPVEVIELSQGCLCCNLKQGFLNIFKSLSERDDVDRVIVEPSGVFLPDEITGLFKGQNSFSVFNLAPLITVVSYDFMQKISARPLPFMIRQIELAETVVLTKLEGLSDVQKNKLREQVTAINPRAPLIDLFSVKLSQLLTNNATGFTSKGKPVSCHTSHTSGHPFESRQVTEGLNFDSKGSVDTFFKSQAANLVRAKGIIAVEDKKFFVDYSNSQFRIEPFLKESPLGLTLIFETAG